MKNLLLLIIFIILVLMMMDESKASNTDDLVDTIESVCEFLNDEVSFDKREDCMLYYVNCSVYGNGETDDKKIMECIRSKGE